MQHHKNRAHGFTLIEAIIAIALGGMIMTAILSIFVSFFHAWKPHQTPYQAFIEHVQQCTRFLQQEANSFESVIDVSALTTQALTTVHFRKENFYVLGAFRKAPIPFLRTLSAHPFFIAWVCDRSGLSLWIETPEIAKKRLTEGIETTGKTHIQKILLSPYVEKLEYGFWNSQKKQWEFAPDLTTYARRFLRKEPMGVRPNGLRITFRKDSWIETRFVHFSSLYAADIQKPVSFTDALNAKPKTDKKTPAKNPSTLPSSNNNTPTRRQKP